MRSKKDSYRRSLPSGSVNHFSFNYTYLNELLSSPTSTDLEVKGMCFSLSVLSACVGGLRVHT